MEALLAELEQKLSNAERLLTEWQAEELRYVSGLYDAAKELRLMNGGSK